MKTVTDPNEEGLNWWCELKGKRSGKETSHSKVNSLFQLQAKVLILSWHKQYHRKPGAGSARGPLSSTVAASKCREAAPGWLCVEGGGDTVWDVALPSIHHITALKAPTFGGEHLPFPAQMPTDSVNGLGCSPSWLSRPNPPIPSHTDQRQVPSTPSFSSSPKWENNFCLLWLLSEDELRPVYSGPRAQYARNLWSLLMLYILFPSLMDLYNIPVFASLTCQRT